MAGPARPLPWKPPAFMKTPIRMSTVTRTPSPYGRMRTPSVCYTKGGPAIRKGDTVNNPILGLWKSLDYGRSIAAMVRACAQKALHRSKSFDLLVSVFRK
eukprot:3545426-Pleurochrysis_carterae.AAC.1